MTATLTHIAATIGTKLGLDHFDLTPSFNEEVNKVYNFAKEGLSTQFGSFLESLNTTTTDQQIPVVDHALNNETLPATSGNEIYDTISSAVQNCNKGYPWLLPLIFMVVTWNVSHAVVKKVATFTNPSATIGKVKNAGIHITSLALTALATHFAYKAADSELEPELCAPLFALSVITSIGITVLCKTSSWGYAKFKATPVKTKVA